jgi:Bacterial regulatory proteins, luxR family
LPPRRYAKKRPAFSVPAQPFPYDSKSNKEAAAALDISARTVKTQLAHQFEKLGVTSRTDAVCVATRRGLVRFD